MARRFHRREALSAMSEINVTPLIDLAFALLIIFMITAPLLEQSIDISLPTESTRPQPETEETVQEIALDKDGNIFWGRDQIDMERLRELVELVSLEPQPPVIQIRADAALPYQRVIDVMDVLKAYNMNKISLETRSR